MIRHKRFKNRKKIKLRNTFAELSVYPKPINTCKRNGSGLMLYTPLK
jgi:hypothetical protein